MDLNKLLKIRQFNALRMEEEGNELWFYGELVDSGKACPDCGKEEVKKHQAYKKWFRHLPICNQPTYIYFERHLLRCLNCDRLFMEHLEFVEPNRHFTLPYEAHIYELCRGQSIERVAQLENLSWDEVEGILKKSGAGQGKTTLGSRRKPQQMLVSG